MAAIPHRLILLAAVVVLALSVASATYGALLGAVLLAGPAGRTRRRAVSGRGVIAGAAVSVLAMLALVALTRLSFLWAVPAGTLLCVGVAWAAALLQRR